MGKEQLPRVSALSRGLMLGRGENIDATVTAPAAVVRYWIVDFRHGSFGAVAFFVFFPLAVCAGDAALLLREIIALDCSVYLVYSDYLNWSAYSGYRIYSACSFY